MMDLPSPLKDEITSYWQKENEFFFDTERGTLKISFNQSKLVHVCFSFDRHFGKTQPWIISSNNISVCIDENEDSFLLKSDSLRVVISKKNSSLKFYNDGQLIFSEDGNFARESEPVKEYLTVDDGQILTSAVKTADGIKNIISSSAKKEGRTLYKTRLHLKFDDSEVLNGLGQSEEGVFNLRGHVKYLHQANRKIAIPVMLSSKGYGLFFPSGSAGMFADNENGTFFQTEACEMLEYYFLGGNSADESISMFRFLTGKAELLPLWAYGYLQSKERYESEAELLETGSEFRNRRIGIDALILDWLTWEDNMWGQKTLDSTRFPNPARMVKNLHEMDLNLMISIWPNMTSACNNYREFKEKGLLYPGTEIYDACNKEARELYWKQTNEGLFRHGFDGFWCDSSEPFTPEWTKKLKPDMAAAYHDFINTACESMPYDEINAYGFYHAMGIYEGQRKISNKRVMNLTRNGYPGSQRFGTVLWSGDIGASFDTLKKQVAEGLNLCASGLPYWTIDIGAFFVKKGNPWYWEGKYPDALDNMGYRELYVRWYQYGAFLPVFRSHGTDCPREPWRFGEPGDMFYDAIIKANELRYKLMPYIYSVAYKVWKDDYTMMRLLSFDYREDEKVWNISDQYMFGPSLMVCPVLSEMYYDVNSLPVEANKTRQVYFPKGNKWVDIRDGRIYEGGTTATVDADIYSIPVFAKNGCIIPMCEGITSTKDMKNSKIMPVVFGEGDCEFDLYADEGDGYEYLTSKPVITKLIHNA